jgi:hypothetical protein
MDHVWEMEMSTRAMARLALLACALACLPVMPVRANDSAHSVADKFASEPERSEAAKREDARKAEDARKREAELKADKAREEAAARRAAEALKADKEKADKARRAKAQPAEAAPKTADRRKIDEDEMVARARRESEEQQAADEARILAEQALAMERAKAELQASQAAEQERAKADAQRRQAGRNKEPDTARAEDDRAKLEALAREAAGVKPAETDRAAEERAKAAELAREAERVKQAEAEARARAEADRLAADWTKRAVANRQAMQKLARMRGIREARLAAQAQRAETQRQLAEAQRKVEEAQRAAAPENRKPEVAELPAPDRPMERRQGSAVETAERQGLGADTPRLPDLRVPDGRERASRDVELPDLRVDGGVPGERTVTVLLVMAPGNYGIRRNGPKVADPIMCTTEGCYVSMGPGAPAKFLPGRKGVGIGNTFGARAGACRQSLSCIFRGIDLDERQGYLQPVDLHILRHDVRRPQMISGDSDCRIDAGRLSCRRGIYAEDYAMWVISERMADRLGPDGLQRALEEGLAAPRSADLQPRPMR